MFRPPLQTPKSALADQAKLIGRRVHLEVDGGLQVECEVVDLKQVFGRTCAQVRPIAGSGATWVNLPRITPIPQPQQSQEIKK